MMKTILLVITAWSTWWMAAAQTKPYYITDPLPGTTWVVNTTATITWKDGSNETITINLIEGRGNTSMVPTGHYLTANGASGSTTWQVPAGLDTNGSYAIRIDYPDQSTNQVMSAYSGAFKVNDNADSANASSSATTTAAHATSLVSSNTTTAAATSSSPSSLSTSSLPRTASIPLNLRPSLAASTTPEAIMSNAKARYTMVAATSITMPFIVARVLLA